MPVDHYEHLLPAWPVRAPHVATDPTQRLATLSEDAALRYWEILKRAEMERSFYAFLKGAWPVLEPSTPYLDNWHIQCICEHLQAASEGEIRKLIFNVPPGSLKSIAVSVCWPAWHWIHHAHDRFLTGSHSMDLSGRDALKSRRLIQSHWYQARWGDRFRLTGDQNAKTRYENDKTGFRVATSVGGATGERANIRIMDDPHQIAEAESDVIREGTVDWIRSTWSERESDALTSIDVLVMQRVHARDVTGYLLELGGFTHVMLPMEYDPKRKFVSGFHSNVVTITEDPRTERGELLFPARWNAAEVAIKKLRLGAYKASGQLAQLPSPEAGGIFKKHWWKYWHYPGEPLPPVKMEMADGTFVDIPCEPLPYEWDRELQSWDCAFKDTATSDFVVGQHWAKKGTKSYLLRQTRGQLDFVATQNAVKAMTEFMVMGGPVLVEDKANGTAVVASLRAKVPGLIGVNPEGGKESRAHAYSYVPESGCCYLPHPTIAPWVDGFVEELRTFPNGEHDDQVDSFTQAMHKLYGATNMGLPITPEYSAKFFVSEADLSPIPGIEAFRFWYVPSVTDGTPYPTCILGQVLPQGQIRVLDCVQLENESLDALIEKKVIPILNASWRGVWKWRDVANFKEAAPGKSEASVQRVVPDKLKGAGVEPWEPDFELRMAALKTILGQTHRLVINRRVSQGERTLLVHEALNGGYSFEADKQGNLSRLAPQKGNPLTAVGECLAGGLAKIFVRAPRPPQTVKDRQAAQAKGMEKAKSYSVKS